MGNQYQKATQLIKNSGTVFVIVPNTAKPSLLCVAVAIYEAIEGEKKLVYGGRLPQRLRFLFKNISLVEKIELKSKTLKLDLPLKTQFEEFWYEKDKESLSVFLHAGESLENFETRPDLVYQDPQPVFLQISGGEENETKCLSHKNTIILGENINTTFFPKALIVEGNIFLVAKELIKSLLGEIKKESSMALLAGLYFYTHSFQKTNSEELKLASELKKEGAEHFQVIKQIYKNKSFDELIQWGLFLKNVVYVHEIKSYVGFVEEEIEILTAQTFLDEMGLALGIASLYGVVFNNGGKTAALLELSEKFDQKSFEKYLHAKQTGNRFLMNLESGPKKARQELVTKLKAWF